ncbi:hypothetical protein SlGVgp091 [Spodoptera litura granulovirus]|uniref:Uncharacterized protein n=1 Tax=Spodoptera litura granulovirus TaxID=359919 RepID=A5IZU3_9BBAC|nr:hypothetical protein SlGVgp091 [Spodoptera litura granulovirus]ABQ52034.1 hypothetical protein SlGVgp091 [Spodoptera litura granulovirus]
MYILKLNKCFYEDKKKYLAEKNGSGCYVASLQKLCMEHVIEMVQNQDVSTDYLLQFEFPQIWLSIFDLMTVNFHMCTFTDLLTYYTDQFIVLHSDEKFYISDEVMQDVFLNMATSYNLINKNVDSIVKQAICLKGATYWDSENDCNQIQQASIEGYISTSDKRYFIVVMLKSFEGLMDYILMPVPVNVVNNLLYYFRFIMQNGDWYTVCEPTRVELVY